MLPWRDALSIGRFATSEIERSSTGDWAKLCNEYRWTFARPASEAGNDRRFSDTFPRCLGHGFDGWLGCDPQKFPLIPPLTRVFAQFEHAVSIDERRAFFRQNLIKPATNQDVVELWFPGVHCDVGGGYPTDEGSLWRVPFQWMLNEAQKAGY